MKKRFSEEQIVKMIQENKEGKSVTEISREYGVAEQTFYKWQQKFGDMKVSDFIFFTSLSEAKEIIENWRIDYNENRPQKGLKELTPSQFKNILKSMKSSP